ncbi:uncharacterized protein EI90DRAFT_3123498 [Cantharellus anzutake]|uniref:uncharacterized protein n=1 Tax=Cantharellus anzutake TaxID=1750568 RepID=UPI001907FB0D|nr:uncharacterized protein EI90DRAFT_3123498 [Cantharellus anzutake]KAF8331350.1 hypothetical protein EI90DRAFT_3123498 [Cantharellus anzutake]
METTEQSAYVTLIFIGTSVQAWLLSANTTSSVDIQIDGIYQTTIDTSNSAQNYWECLPKVWYSSPLPAGQHAITVLHRKLNGDRPYLDFIKYIYIPVPVPSTPGNTSTPGPTNTPGNTSTTSTVGPTSTPGSTGTTSTVGLTSTSGSTCVPGYAGTSGHSTSTCTPGPTNTPTHRNTVGLKVGLAIGWVVAGILAAVAWKYRPAGERETDVPVRTATERARGTQHSGPPVYTPSPGALELGAIKSSGGSAQAGKRGAPTTSAYDLL